MPLPPPAVSRRYARPPFRDDANFSSRRYHKLPAAAYAEAAPLPLAAPRLSATAALPPPALVTAETEEPPSGSSFGGAFGGAWSSLGTSSAPSSKRGEASLPVGDSLLT